MRGTRLARRTRGRGDVTGDARLSQGGTGVLREGGGRERECNRVTAQIVRDAGCLSELDRRRRCRVVGFDEVLLRRVRWWQRGYRGPSRARGGTRVRRSRDPHAGHGRARCSARSGCPTHSTQLGHSPGDETFSVAQITPPTSPPTSSPKSHLSSLAECQSEKGARVKIAAPCGFSSCT